VKSLNFLEEIACEICKFSAAPKEFPDIETKSFIKKDFDILPEESKATLKKFGHDINDAECRIALHGNILICPACGNMKDFHLKIHGG